MKRTISLILLFLLIIPLVAKPQMKWNSTYQNYIDAYKDIAIQEMLRYGIPASITLAQGLLESGAGLSELSQKGNNHFGIKCHGWNGRTTYHDDDESQECFRAYDSPLQSYEDHSKFLSSSQRYRSLFSLKRSDYKGWAHGLKAAGYATNPIYAQKLIDIIETYQLYQYDTASDYDHFMAKRTAVSKPAKVGGSLHPIHLYNKNYYIWVRNGDTFKSIGKEIDISYRKIAKYNERNKDERLREGEIIWLKKKQKHAPKDFKGKKHTVSSMESMYSIAQKYGIRLKSLYKMNKMSPDDELQVGQQLRIY